MFNNILLNPDPEVFELSCGETYSSKLGGDCTRNLKLVSCRNITEPFFCNGRWHEIFISSEVKLEIDGLPVLVHCSPYKLPVNIHGLNIMVDLTKGVDEGLNAVKLSKDARLSVKVSSLPWYDDYRFEFPIVNYRWRASNYAHTWNGFVHAEGNGIVYYHRGEDFGAIPDRHNFVSINDSVIDLIPHAGGDGKSNAISASDETLTYMYCHANSDTIRKDLEMGYKLKKGEEIAKTGNTWNGRPVEDPHLHIGISKKENGLMINSYPILVHAYREKYPEEILAVAGGFRFCKEGEILTLDASCSVVPPSTSVKKYIWKFCDASSMEGVKVEKQYSDAGTYTEELIIIDTNGNEFRDFVIVSVSRNGCELPFAWFNYYPIREIKAGTPVEFLLDHLNMNNVKINYGDGVLPQDCPRYQTHSYDEPGYYIVTVHGDGTDCGQGIFKVCLKVGE